MTTVKPDAAHGIPITGFTILRPNVDAALNCLPPAILAAIRSAEPTIRILDPRESFADIARRYDVCDRAGYNVCQGLYDHNTRIIILRTAQPYVVAHEALHVVDFILGENYKTRSQIDDRILRAYRRHCKDRMTISAYSQVSVAEFAAETMRALLGFSPPRPPNRPSDRDRLKRIDPNLVELCTAWLDEIAQMFPAPSSEPPLCQSQPLN